MKLHRNLYVSFAVCLLGALIYVLFRKPVIFTRPFFPDETVFPIISLPKSKLSDFFLYQMADILWCLAVLIYSSTISNKIIKILAILLPFAMEIGQFFGIVRGTFDLLDLSVYALITTIYFTTKYIILKMKQNKTRLTILANIAGLAVFALAAMASSSSQDAYNTIDGAVEGWRYARDHSMETSIDPYQSEADSVAASNQLMAINLPE